MDLLIIYFEVFMKKKLLILIVLSCCVLSLFGCKKAEINLADYIIEERNNLFTANDDIYNVNISSGQREENYNFDGVVGPMVDFAVITFLRNDNLPLANDNYTYLVKVNENEYSGFLEKSPVDNSYVADFGISIPNDAEVEIRISFTGYTFKQKLLNTSNKFSVDTNSAIKIATEQLKDNIKNILSTSNAKIEVVMKILKDYSIEDTPKYYWYIGIVSTNGETLGILIDAENGDIIAKKV